MNLGKSWTWRVVGIVIVIAAVAAGVVIEENMPELPDDFPNDLYGVVLTAVLLVALCLGFALYLVYPNVLLKYSRELPKGKAISKVDLLPDDQARLGNYSAVSNGKDDPLVYSMLLYLHTAAGDRANGVERGSRIALGFAVAALITVHLDNRFLLWVLVSFGFTALTNSMVWGPSFVRWLRNEDRT